MAWWAWAIVVLAFSATVIISFGISCANFEARREERANTQKEVQSRTARLLAKKAAREKTKQVLAAPYYLGPEELCDACGSVEHAVKAVVQHHTPYGSFRVAPYLTKSCSTCGLIVLRRFIRKSATRPRRVPTRSIRLDRTEANG